MIERERDRDIDGYKDNKRKIRRMLKKRYGIIVRESVLLVTNLQENFQNR